MSGNQDSTSPGKNKSGFFSRYAVVIACFLAMVAGAMAFVSFGVFFKPISTQFGWTHTETSGAFSLMMILGGLLSISAGRLGDRFGQGLVIIIGGILEGSGYLLLSRTTSLWELYFFFGILCGVGVSSVAPLTSLVTRYYTGNRGLMTGIAMAGAGVGGTAVPPIVLYFITNYGWQTAYLVIGGMILVLIVIIGVILHYARQIRRPVHEKMSSPDEALPPVRNLTLRRAMKTPPFWILGAIIFLCGFSQQVVTVHLVPASGDLGITAAMAAVILSLINLSSTGGSFVVGTIVDRIGGFASVVIALATSAAGIVLMLSLREGWTFYLFAILFGIGWGVITISRSIMVADLFGFLAHGEIVGAIIFCYSVGGTLGPTLAGYIYDVNQDYQLAFTLIGGLCLLNLVLTLPLKFLSPKALSST